MQKTLIRLKNNRFLFILIITTIIAILIGILFLAIQNNEIKNEINNSLNTVIKTINSNKYNNIHIFKNSIKTDILINTMIWILGLSIIGIPIILIIYILKCLMLGFTIASYIYFYHFNGLIIGVIYLIPYIINILILLIMVYYSINFSIIAFNSIFKDKNYNKRLIVKRYFKILVVSSIIFLFSSLIEGYIIPTILKLIISE